MSILQVVLGAGQGPYLVDILAVGGGGSGGSGVSGHPAGGGGSGRVKQVDTILVYPGESYPIVIGQGGASAGTNTGNRGNAGGATTGLSVTAGGGGGGGAYNNINGGTSPTPWTNDGAGGGGGWGFFSYGSGGVSTGIGDGAAANASGWGGGGGGQGTTIADTSSSGDAPFNSINGCGGRGWDASVFVPTSVWEWGSGISIIACGAPGGKAAGRQGSSTMAYPEATDGAGSAGGPAANSGSGGMGPAGSLTASQPGAAGIYMIRYRGGQKGTGGNHIETNGLSSLEYTWHVFTANGTFIA